MVELSGVLHTAEVAEGGIVLTAQMNTGLADRAAAEMAAEMEVVDMLAPMDWEAVAEAFRGRLLLSMAEKAAMVGL
jgi:hypothetical protein